MDGVEKSLFPIGRKVFYVVQCENGSRLAYPFNIMHVDNSILLEDFSGEQVVCNINDRKLYLTQDECFAVCAAYNDEWINQHREMQRKDK